MRVDTSLTIVCDGVPLVTIDVTDHGIDARVADSAGESLFTLRGSSRAQVAGLLEDIARQVRRHDAWPDELCLRRAGSTWADTSPLCELAEGHDGPHRVTGLDPVGAARLAELDDAARGRS